VLVKRLSLKLLPQKTVLAWAPWVHASAKARQRYRERLRSVFIGGGVFWLF